MSIVMNEIEQKQIDSQVEQMMGWANNRKAEAEQLALDSARLMSCTSEKMDRLTKQGFFKRCWDRFSGAAGEMERANDADLIKMQKMSFRYLNMLQEQQVLMAHSMLSLKNNLLSLAVKEEETRNLVALLAQRTLDRFTQLETRVDQLEVSTNLQGWLLGLEERDYEEKIPTEYMRLFRVLNDFYSIKNDEWNYNDLMFMRKAIRTVGIDPKKKLSLNAFINGLTDEIQSQGVGFESYGKAITAFKPENLDNYSKFVLDNISSPVFVSMHGLKSQYIDRLDMVEELQDELNISAGEALKRLLRRSITNLNVNLDYEFPLAETAIEILGCIRLTNELLNINQSSHSQIIDKKKDVEQLNSNNSMDIADYQVGECHTIKSGYDKVHHISFENGKFYAAFYNDSIARTVVCFSNNLVKWTELFEIPISEINGRIDEIRCLDGKLILKFRNKLFISEDMKEYEVIILDASYNNYDIDYNGLYQNRIFFISGIWYIIGMFKTDFHTRMIIFSGEELDNLNQYTTLDSFGTTYLSNESYTTDDNCLYLCLSGSCNTDGVIVILSRYDYKAIKFSNEEGFRKLYFLNNQLYMKSGYKIATKNLDNESFTIVNSDFPLLSEFRVFNSSNIAIGYRDLDLFITEDFATTKHISMQSQTSRSFTYGNGILVEWFIGNDDYDIRFRRIL